MRDSFDPLVLKKGLLLTVLAAATLIYGLFLAPPLAPSIDETIYHAAIERFAMGGHLTLPNGYLAFPSETLRLMVLIPSENGLAPQYPAGYAILAAPFFHLLGAQGAVLINALAFVAILGLTYLIGRELFEDEHLALNAALFMGLCTFSIEYAFTVFPHVLSGAVVALAAYLAIIGVKRETLSHSLFLLGSAGLVVGLGVNIRLDIILAAPAIGVWLLGSGRMPVIRIAAFASALAPGLAMSGYLNYVKFGLFKFFSYGFEFLPGEETLASVSVYGALLPLVPVIGALAVGFAFPAFRNLFLGLRGLIIGTGIVAAVLVMPFTSAIALQLLRGLYVLLVDLQSLDFIRQAGIHDVGGGKIMFLGRVKKALFESMPYAGFIPLAIAELFKVRHRGAVALCCLLALAWYTFYGVNQWHGGSGTNVRYFLPTLPFVSILAALAWRELAPEWSIQGRQTRWLWFILVAIGLALALLFLSVKPILPVFFLLGGGRLLFLIAVGLSVVLLLLPNLGPYLKRAAILFYTLCLAVAFFGAYFADLYLSQDRRYAHAERMRQYSYEFLEPNALVITLAISRFYQHLARPEGMLARGLDASTSIDFSLIDWALDQGRPVYIQGAIRLEFERHPGSGAYRIERMKETLDQEMYRVFRAR
ncbi:MAG: hypothetical protein R3229_08275 [Alphaproteobacteria bacterium]|nr:hypothetical protein [Alphaproteobacteria bacterium]